MLLQLCVLLLFFSYTHTQHFLFTQLFHTSWSVHRLVALYIFFLGRGSEQGTQNQKRMMHLRPLGGGYILFSDDTTLSLS
jgi:hypothetical protein